MDSEIVPDYCAGEAFFNNVKLFLAEERPFRGLEMRLVREPLEVPARLALTEDERKRTLDYQTGEPIERSVRFGYDYFLTYAVKREPHDRELPEHPIGDANRNFDDLDKFEKAVKGQVGSILARLASFYPEKITIAILDEEPKEVNSELIAELGGDAKAKIAYLSTARHPPSPPEQAASQQRAMKIL